MLGFAPVLGLDHELESVAGGAENARVNGVALEVRRFDLRHEALPWIADEQPRRRRCRRGPPTSPRAPRDPSCSPTCCARCCSSWPPRSPAPPAHLIASGLLVARGRRGRRRVHGQRCGLSERARRQSGDWAACGSAARADQARVGHLGGRRGRSRGRPGRSPGARRPLRASSASAARSARADRLQRLAGVGPARGRGRPRSPCRASPGLLDDAREQRRADEARVVRRRAPGARELDRAAAPRSAVRAAGHGRRAARPSCRPAPRVVAASSRPRLRGDAQRHVEGRRGHAVGRVGGEHDPLGGHAREQLDHVEREEAGDVVEHARVVGQARGEDALVADRAVREDQHRARMAQREVDEPVGERRQAAAGMDQDRHPRLLGQLEDAVHLRRRRRRSPARAGAA